MKFRSVFTGATMLLLAMPAFGAGSDRNTPIPTLQGGPDTMTLSVAPNPDLMLMEVRVFDVQGNEIFSDSSENGEVLLPYAADLADGVYQYSSTAYHAVDPVAASEMAGNPEFLTTKRNGYLYIQDGQFKQKHELDLKRWNDRPEANNNDVSLLNRAIAGLAGIISSDALAQDVTVDDGTPQIFFEDTNTAAGAEWEIFGNGSSTTGFFFIQEEIGSNSDNIISIDGTDASGEATDSIDIKTDGDIEMAGGNFVLERSGQLVIGANQSIQSTPDLEIIDSLPVISMYDTDNSNNWFASFFNNGTYTLQSSEGGFVLRIDEEAGSNSLVIDADGDVGLGTSTPLGDLEIQGGQLYLTDSGHDWHFNPGGTGLWFNNITDGTNPVKFNNDAPSDSLVVESGTGDIGLGTSSPDADLDIQAAAPDLRFTDNGQGNAMDLELSNNFLRIQGASGQDIGKINAGAPVGTFTTDAAGRTGYGTANPAASFNVKYRSAHGAVPVLLIQKPNNDEIFKVNFNGDTFVNGAIVHSSDANEKTNVQSVNYAQILEKVATLPIQQWQYKDAVGVDHIGPMAQDFHATFNLGSTNKGIATVDASGVALAAIKALALENGQLELSNKKQSEELAKLKSAHRQLLAAYHAQQDTLAQIDSDRERLAQLEAVVAEMAVGQAEPVLTSAK